MVFIGRCVQRRLILEECAWGYFIYTSQAAETERGRERKGQGEAVGELHSYQIHILQIYIFIVFV